ncbi:MAG: hypothetical protein JOZ11_18700 [Alphaproteobacteria bacterium]|nr:hypothetical protein [Alphaproteobacteria bacterium]
MQFAAVAADRNNPQKHVLAGTDYPGDGKGCGTGEISATPEISKPRVLRWQATPRCQLANSIVGNYAAH